MTVSRHVWIALCSVVWWAREDRWLTAINHLGHGVQIYHRPAKHEAGR